MAPDSKQVLKTLNPNKVWVPVIIGIVAVIAIFYFDPDLSVDKIKLIFNAAPVPLLLAFLVILARDLGYMYRIRTLTNNELTWKGSIYTILLWEFASAVTPSVVGGTAVAVFILMKEGIHLGKSLAYVMLTAILDNLFFVIAAPFAILFIGDHIFPEVMDTETFLGRSLKAVFFTSYSMIAVYTLIMSLALLYRPRVFKWLLLKVSTIGFLRKWRHAANEYGDQVIDASKQIRGKDVGYWTKVILSTIFVWSARYLMLNFLIEAYTFGLSFFDHFVIFGKNLILWITMLFSPTPGSSLTAEYFFKIFYKDVLGDYTAASLLSWRMMSYYPYLFLGLFILPRWIRRVFFKGRKR